MNSEKRGISAIVATVLIVLVVVAGVVIMWGSVIPIIKDKSSSFSEEDVSLKVVGDKGYTAYDPETGLVTVQVDRSNDNLTLSGVDIIISFNGSSVTTRVPAPLPGNVKTYTIDVSLYGHPYSVRVAPVYSNGQVGGAGPEEDIPIGTLDKDTSGIIYYAGTNETSETELPTCGDELVIDGRFYNGFSNWTAGTGWEFVDGRAKVTRQGYHVLSGNLSQDIGAVAGRSYNISVNITWGYETGIEGGIGNNVVRFERGVTSKIIEAENDGDLLRFYEVGLLVDSWVYAYLDDISVREVCVEEEEPACTDSDGGWSNFQKGYTNAGVINSSDYCFSEDVLVEFGCGNPPGITPIDPPYLGFGGWISTRDTIESSGFGKVTMSRYGFYVNLVSVNSDYATFELFGEEYDFSVGEGKELGDTGMFLKLNELYTSHPSYDGHPAVSVSLANMYYSSNNVPCQCVDGACVEENVSLDSCADLSIHTSANLVTNNKEHVIYYDGYGAQSTAPYWLAIKVDGEYMELSSDSAGNFEPIGLSDGMEIRVNYTYSTRKITACLEGVGPGDLNSSFCMGYSNEIECLNDNDCFWNDYGSFSVCEDGNFSCQNQCSFVGENRCLSQGGRWSKTCVQQGDCLVWQESLCEYACWDGECISSDEANQTCEDTDGGIVKSIAGQTTVSINGIPQYGNWDFCTYYPTQLFEYSCYNDGIKQTILNCTNGCSNRACT